MIGAPVSRALEIFVVGRIFLAALR